MPVSKKDVLKHILLQEFERMEYEVVSFEDDPMQFILKKYAGLKNVLVYLMSPSFEDYVTGIYVVAPKPTTFKVVLHNGQYFFLQFMGKAYQATVAGKNYYLMTIGEKERCMLAIARILRYGPTLKTKGPEGAEQATRKETEIDATTTTEKPAPEGGEEQPLAEGKILEGILKKSLYEKKLSYEELSPEAQKVGKDIMKALKIPKEDIRGASKNRIVVLTDVPRKDVFAALDKLGYKKDTKVSGSSAGGYVTKDGVEIIHKSKALTSVGGAGIANEYAFVDQIQKAIESNGGKVNLVISDGKKTVNLTKVTQAIQIGKEGEKQGWKGDAKVISSEGQTNFSIKQDGPFRWASVMKDYSDFYNAFMKKAAAGEIPGLSLKKDPNQPKVLMMWDTKNKKPYGRIFVKNAPGLDIKKLAFGPDNAIILQRTFTENDFKEGKNKLDITVSKIIKSVKDFEPGDMPVLEFERNASKATQSKGLTGRGIILRVSPIERMQKAGSGANNLVIDYNDII